ncbi:MAG TPA: hypothetical protein VNO21_16035, partial [Polyangiaceae bacterium]|nr:hypothetical protein [Polyangiaceae bacterium]
YDPSATEIVRRVDGLLRDQGNPNERLLLYQSALERERDASQQRRLLHGIGALARHELKDPNGAIEAYRNALDIEAEDRDAYAALCELYEDVEAWPQLIELFEMRVSQLDGTPDAVRVRAQLAETAAAHQQPERASRHARALLEDPVLTVDELDAVERVAHSIGDADLSSAAFERRAASAGDPRDAIVALGKLGASRQAQGDTPAAIDAWKRAGRLASESNELEAAHRFYELVRKVAPRDPEANERLIALLEAQEQWAAVPALYAVMIDSAKSTEARCALLLRLARVLSDRLGDPSGAADAVARAFTLDPSNTESLSLFEKLAVQSGETAGFVRAIDSAVDELSPASPSPAARLLMSKARVLSKDPQRQDEATETYRALLEDRDVDATQRAGAVAQFSTLLEGSDASAKRHADRRWLLAWRANHAQREEKIGHLLTWARAEEALFADAEAALDVHRQVLVLDPENTEASAAVARLTLATGDVDGAVSALFAQRERADGAARRAIDLEIATILIERATDLDDALKCVASLLEEAPDDAEALALTGRLLRMPKVGQEAASLLEKASHRVEDADARANIVNALLEGPPEVAGVTARRAWFERLIASHEAKGKKEAALLTTLRAAEEFPLESSFWDGAEALARELQDPGSLADLYYRVLGGVISPEGALEIGQRAVAFHEEWFDDPSRVIALLERVLTIDPTASWAFDRLKLLFDAREQWDELFALYDRAIVVASVERRIELLEDAAQIAKDFANHSDRAIFYLEKLLALKPKNARITAALERLYERHGKHRELIALLTSQLETMSGAESRAARIRMAGMLLDHLNDVAGALAAVEGILTAESEGPPSLPSVGDARASVRLKLVELLERILQATAESKGTQARQHAATLLKEHYVETERDGDLARVLEVELEAFEDPKKRVAGHKSIAELYGRLGQDPQALEHYVALVMLEPEAASHRERLTALAEKIGQFDRAAEVLAKAADLPVDEALRIDLLMRAATMHEDRLGDGERAIELYSRVLAIRGAGKDALLAATRRLDPLLLLASRPRDRLSVLERMSELETDARARRTALGTAAELAAELGEDERAITAYDRRLADDDSDAEALDGLIALLERGKRWRPLIDALGRRATIVVSKEQKRADHVTLARIHRQELDEPDAAIAIWHGIQSDFGPSEEGTRALAGLLHGVGRWTELASLLEESAARAEKPEVRATFLRQLGDVFRERLDDPARAIENYRAALEASPREPGALDGLYDLVADEDSRADAVRVLYAAHTQAGEWQAALDLTEHRLTAATSDEARGRILKEAAWLAEQRLSDQLTAYRFVGRAFILAPHDLELETSLFRLAEDTSGWRAFADTHQRVIEAAQAADPKDAPLLGRLHQHLGEALERRLDDSEGALQAYAHAVEITPDDADAVRAVVRVAGPNMRWDAAARAAILHAVSTHSLDESLWTTLESVATTPAAWDAATEALARNTAEHK